MMNDELNLFKVNNKNTATTSTGVFVMLLLVTSNITGYFIHSNQ